MWKSLLITRSCEFECLESFIMKIHKYSPQTFVLTSRKYSSLEYPPNFPWAIIVYIQHIIFWNNFMSHFRIKLCEHADTSRKQGSLIFFAWIFPSTGYLSLRSRAYWQFSTIFLFLLWKSNLVSEFSPDGMQYFFLKNISALNVTPARLRKSHFCKKNPTRFHIINGTRTCFGLI